MEEEGTGLISHTLINFKISHLGFAMGDRYMEAPPHDFHDSKDMQVLVPNTRGHL